MVRLRFHLQGHLCVDADPWSPTQSKPQLRERDCRETPNSDLHLTSAARDLFVDYDGGGMVRLQVKPNTLDGPDTSNRGCLGLPCYVTGSRSEGEIATPNPPESHAAQTSAGLPKRD